MKICKAISFVSSMFCLAAASALFLPIFDLYKINFNQGLFLFICMGSLLVCSCRYSEKYNELKGVLEKLLKNFNLAKVELQPVLLDLEKQLVQHNCELQSISNGSKFNFKKNEKFLD